MALNKLIDVLEENSEEMPYALLVEILHEHYPHNCEVVTDELTNQCWYILLDYDGKHYVTTTKDEEEYTSIVHLTTALCMMRLSPGI